MEILGVRVDEVNMNEAVEKAKKFLTTDTCDTIFTPNPEFIMTADKDKEFKKILNSSSLNIPDGNGIVWASKKIGKPLGERVAGYDFIHKLFDYGKDNNISFYFLGARPGIAEKARDKAVDTYPGLKIVGTCDGYFAKEDEKKIVKDISELKPDILLVALGSPKQEKFINDYKNELGCKIAIGVGGCFDVMSGEVKRAPNLFINLKLEWLYRGLTDIKRLKRLKAIPLFMLKVSKHTK